MAKKQFVRGSWLLEKDVADSNAYYEAHVGFGLSEDRTYLCEYEVLSDTKAMCKGVASELKANLKPKWKGISLGYQIFGRKY